MKDIVECIFGSNNYRDYTLDENSVEWYWNLFTLDYKESFKSLILQHLDINKTYLILKRKEK